MAGPGRPSLYKEEYCQKTIEIMAAGNSLNSVSKELSVNTDTLYEWQSKHPEYSEAVKRGRELQAVWWENLGKGAAVGKIPGFNATAFIWMTKNMLKWRDRQDIELSGKQDGAPIQVQNMQAKALSDEQLKALAEKALQSKDLSTEILIEGE